MPMAIENEFSRFKIWAGNLGALQRGRSSLDARLRDSIVLRAAVLKFLGQLQDSLSKSAEITTGLRLPYEQGSDVPPTPDEEIEDSDSSDSSAAGSDLITGELAERLDEIKDIMEHLYRLSFKIRNTRYRSLTKKALLMKEENPQTGKDLFSAYAIFDRRHVQELLDHLRLRPSSQEFTAEHVRDPNHDFVDILDARDHLLDGGDFLRDRLAKAITNRRRYFAYWQRHALKLSHITDEPTHQQSPATLVRPAEPVSQPPITLRVSGNFMPTPKTKSMVSGTDFSMYNREMDDQLETETVISYATTAYDIDGKSPELPPPPSDAAKHIRQDLQPYVCTYEKCPDADRMYSSRHTWLEHERLVHRRVWRCFEHRFFISISKDGLLQHFSDCHKGLDRQQIENLLDLAETTVADDRKMCPFCYSVGPFNKGFYNHVAFHQEQVATFAVPRNFDGNEESDSARAEGIRSAGSLPSVALDFSDDSSLHSDKIEESRNKVDDHLISAAEMGDEAEVRMVLAKGADVNAQGGEYGTALQAASHCEVMQILLAKGADVNAQDGEYGTALQAASFRGYTEVMQMLLDRGADVNAQGREFGTALQAASHCSQIEVMQILLDRGANVNAQAGRYATALQVASFKGHTEVMQMLLDRGADVNAQGGEFGTALQAASYSGSKRAVQMLLDRGADVNAQGGRHGTALQVASFKGYTEVMQMLLDRGADVNA
ncbi:hypothetical protein N7462_004078 [Penicillium macrosclerotiorum]|uniref:uncharacterized protein n=1 Tax=Penicillium macrosclerotiorum TaxID=303699 RepID=UPI0025488F44|nr:uncharacterized protein N7462_004078 [Penicillium macrosclerotiorum]KAJ5689686.1 hypothetical protein N7462_004078 [Penicillium macrosclerotiorum]